MRLHGIQAARGIAALLVILRHATIILSDPAHPGSLPLGGLFMFGRAGVEFFFVLSGFIMVYVHREDFGRPVAFGSFWAKRLVRIYPLYWIATLILGAILAISPTNDLAERNPVHVLFSFLLLPEAHDPILDVGWSLRLEMLFYLLFSVAILSRLVGGLLMVGWLIGIVANIALTTASGSSPLGLYGDAFVFRIFNLDFFLGAAAAFAVTRPLPGARVLLAIGVTLFLANGLFESFGPPGTEWPPRTITYGLASALIVYAAALLDRARGWRVPGTLVALGEASYSIYLVHVILLLIYGQAAKFAMRVVSVPNLLVFVGGVIIAVVGGWCFSLVVERPLLGVARRALSPRPVGQRSL